MKPQAEPFTQILPSEGIISTSTSKSRDLSSLRDSTTVTQNSVSSSTIKSQITDSTIPTPVTEDVQVNVSSASPLSGTCGAAFSCGDEVGAVIQHIYVSMSSTLSLYHDDELCYGSLPSLSGIGSSATLDTQGEQLLDDMNTLREIISWNTHGSVSTIASMSTIDTSPNIDINGSYTKAHQTRLKGIDKLSHCEQITKCIDTKAKYDPLEKKTKSKNRKKEVKFDYPHISSLRLCPRIMNEDKSALFFTEDELDQYYHDQKILHGTVEVMSTCESNCGSGEISPTLNKSGNKADGMIVHKYRIIYDAINDSDYEKILLGKKAISQSFNESDDLGSIIKVASFIESDDKLDNHGSIKLKIDDGNLPSLNGSHVLKSKITNSTKRSLKDWIKVGKKVILPRRSLRY